MRALTAPRLEARIQRGVSAIINSSALNENQYEKNSFAVVALQKSYENVDMQLSYYNRYSELHFVPDPIGDLLINNVDTDVFRSSFVNGRSGRLSVQAE